MKVEELVNKNRDILNKTDLYIWKYIKNHKTECINYSIYDLAEKCNVSRTTIMRFAQKLSLKGYSELKALLSIENKEKERIVTNENTMDEYFDTYIRMTEDLKKKNWDNINKLLYNADLIFGCASGEMQKNVLSEIKRMFNNSGGLYVIDVGSGVESKKIANFITSKSVAIIISLSGENKEIIEFARELKIKEIPIISITEFSDNTLSSLADENLFVYMPKLVSQITSEEAVSSVGFFMIAEAMFNSYQIYKIEHM